MAVALGELPGHLGEHRLVTGAEGRPGEAEEPELGGLLPEVLGRLAKDFSGRKDVGDV